MNRIILQASDLKTKLEAMNLNRGSCTLASIDAVDYYPSVRFMLIRKAVHYYSKDLPESLQETIDHCLDMIKFGMK